MGPRKSYNYGTFIAPPGRCEETTHFENGGTVVNFSQGSGAPISTVTGNEYRVVSAGLQLAEHGAEVIIVQMDDDVARARGLCEGDAVSHIEGEPLLGSLAAGASLIENAGDSVTLRIQPSGGGAHAGGGFPGKAKFRVVQHVVRQGDSVDALAELYGVTADEVRLWNRKYFPVGEPGFLCPGQILTLRDTTTTTVEKPRDSQGPSARRRKSEGDGGRKRMLYQVCEGDSLKSICARLKLKEGEVRGLNRSVFPIGEPGAVFPGQMLTVFAQECDILISEEDGERAFMSHSSATEGGERAFMQSFAGRKTRRSSLNLGLRGAGVMG